MTIKDDESRGNKSQPVLLNKDHISFRDRVAVRTVKTCNSGVVIYYVGTFKDT